MTRKSDPRKRKLIVVGGLLVAALVLASAFLVGSGAVFTSSSANPSNVFTAGILTNTNNHSGSAILTASLMKPGDSQTGTVTISNTGNISGDFSVYAQKISSAHGTNGGDLYATLQLKIEDCTTVIYNGALNAFNASTSPLALGTYAPADAHTYKLTVSFPNNGTPGGNTTGDNAYQGSATTVEFNWTAVQH